MENLTINNEKPDESRIRRIGKGALKGAVKLVRGVASLISRDSNEPFVTRSYGEIMATTTKEETKGGLEVIREDIRFVRERINEEKNNG